MFPFLNKLNKDTRTHNAVTLETLDKFCFHTK